MFFLLYFPVSENCINFELASCSSFNHSKSLALISLLAICIFLFLANVKEIVH